MKPEIKITTRTNPEAKRLCKAINNSSFRKTITVNQGISNGQYGFVGNETDVKVANLNQPYLNFEFDSVSNEIFVDDMTRYLMLEQINKNSILVIELNVYKGNKLMASVMLFPDNISIVNKNAYELISPECCLNYNNEIFNERSNSNGR